MENYENSPSQQSQLIWGYTIVKYKTENQEEFMDKVSPLQMQTLPSSWTGQWRFSKQSLIKDDKKFQQLNEQSIFSLIVQTNIFKLFLGYNQLPSIIKHVRQIRFPCLKTLQLCQNNIKNIEDLCSINFPNLQRLLLNKNLITKINNFSKLSLPFLKTIDLSSNHITCANELSKTKLNQQQIYQLIIEGNYCDMTLCQDISNLAKIASNYISYRRLKFLEKKISQNKIVKIMSKRVCFFEIDQ